MGCCSLTVVVLKLLQAYKGMTGFTDRRAALAWLLPFHALFRRLLWAGTRQWCWRRPNQPMLMAPAEEYREAQSTGQRPSAKTKPVEDLEAQSLKFPPNLNRSPKCSSRTKASAN